MMPDDPKLKSVLLSMNKSLARVLINAGLNTRACVDLVKLAFVEAVAEDYGKDGKLASISQTARVTGLTRAEVKRLLSSDKARKLPTIASSYPEGVALHFWHSDPAFLDDNGDPSLLAYGPGEGTFSDLVEKHVEKYDPATLLDRLQKQQCVARRDDGLLQAIKRNFSDRGALALALGSMETMAQTIAHNNLNKDEPSMLQRTVYSHTIDRADLARVRRLLRAKGANFCEEVDDLFAGHEVSDPVGTNQTSDASLITAGLGVYYYEKPTEK